MLPLRCLPADGNKRKEGPRSLLGKRLAAPFRNGNDRGPHCTRELVACDGHATLRARRAIIQIILTVATAKSCRGFHQMTSHSVALDGPNSDDISMGPMACLAAPLVSNVEMDGFALIIESIAGRFRNDRSEDAMTETMRDLDQPCECWSKVNEERANRKSALISRACPQTLSTRFCLLLCSSIKSRRDDNLAFNATLFSGGCVERKLINKSQRRIDAYVHGIGIKLSLSLSLSLSCVCVCVCVCVCDLSIRLH